MVPSKVSIKAHVSISLGLRETAQVQQPLRSRRGSLRTTLTAAQRSLRPPEAPGVCGLSKTGAFFLPFPWRDYQLHLSQKLRLNLLSRSRGSRGSSAHGVRLSACPRGPGEMGMAKVRIETQRLQTSAAEKPPVPAEPVAFLRGSGSALGSCTSAIPKTTLNQTNLKRARLK